MAIHSFRKVGLLSAVQVELLFMIGGLPRYKGSPDSEFQEILLCCSFDVAGPFVFAFVTTVGHPL